MQQLIVVSSSFCHVLEVISTSPFEVLPPVLPGTATRANSSRTNLSSERKTCRHWREREREGALASCTKISLRPLPPLKSREKSNRFFLSLFFMGVCKEEANSFSSALLLRLLLLLLLYGETYFVEWGVTVCAVHNLEDLCV